MNRCSKLYNIGVTEVRCKILTLLETTGGILFSLEGFQKILFTIKNFTQGDLHSTGGIQIYIQRVYNSTGGIQISIQGMHNFNGRIKISILGVYNSTGRIRYSSMRYLIPLEGFRYPSEGL